VPQPKAVPRADRQSPRQACACRCHPAQGCGECRQQVLEGSQGTQASAPDVRIQQIEQEQSGETSDREARPGPRAEVSQGREAGEASQRVQPQQKGVAQTGPAQGQPDDPTAEQREPGGPASPAPSEPTGAVETQSGRAHPSAEDPTAQQGGRADDQAQPRQGVERARGEHCPDRHEGAQGGDHRRQERAGREGAERNHRQQQAQAANQPAAGKVPMRASNPGLRVWNLRFSPTSCFQREPLKRNASRRHYEPP
jgi:hypothetical protein